MLSDETIKFLAGNKDSILAIAALGALMMTAFSTTMTLFGAIYSKKVDERIKRQESIRKLFEDGVMGMGENIHGILSAADILLTKYEKEVHENDPSLDHSIRKYKRNISEHKKNLSKAKTVYRYKLYGLEDGLTIITRCTDWIQGYKNDIPTARKMLIEANNISTIIDEEIIRCYRKGDYPSKTARKKIAYHAEKIKKIKQSSTR